MFTLRRRRGPAPTIPTAIELAAEREVRRQLAEVQASLDEEAAEVARYRAQVSALRSSLGRVEEAIREDRRQVDQIARYLGQIGDAMRAHGYDVPPLPDLAAA